MSLRTTVLGFSILPTTIIFKEDKKQKAGFDTSFYSPNFTNDSASLEDINQVLDGVSDARSAFKKRLYSSSIVLSVSLLSILILYCSSEKPTRNLNLLNLSFIIYLCIVLQSLAVLFVHVTDTKFIGDYIRQCNTTFLQRGLQWHLPFITEGSVELKQKTHDDKEIEQGSTVLVLADPTGPDSSFAVTSDSPSYGRQDVHEPVEWIPDRSLMESKIVFHSNTWSRMGFAAGFYFPSLTNGSISAEMVDITLKRLHSMRRFYSNKIAYCISMLTLVIFAWLAAMIWTTYVEGDSFEVAEPLRGLIVASFGIVAIGVCYISFNLKRGKACIQGFLDECNQDLAGTAFRWYLPGSFSGDVELWRNSAKGKSMHHSYQQLSTSLKEQPIRINRGKYGSC